MKKKRTPGELALGRKKFKVEELLLIIIFVLISVGAIYFGQYTVKRLEYAQRSKGYYTENAQGFRLYLKDRSQDPFEVNPYLTSIIARHPGCGLYAYTTQPGRTKIVVTAYSTTMPVDLQLPAGGRFMTAEESVGSTPVCVMGADKYKMEQSGGQFYSKSEGVEYFTQLTPPKIPHTIIGTCGREGSNSVLSQVVFLNLGSYPLTCYSYINYIADGPDAESVAAMLSDVEKVFTEINFDFRTTTLPSGEFTVADFFAMDRLNLIMRVFAVFCVVMSTVPLTLYWSMRRKKPTAVRRLLGRSVSSQAFRMLGRLLLLFHIGFAVGCAGAAIFLGMKLFSLQLLLAYAAGLVVNMAIAAVPLVQTMRVEPGDALRRE